MLLRSQVIPLSDAFRALYTSLSTGVMYTWVQLMFTIFILISAPGTCPMSKEWFSLHARSVLSINFKLLISITNVKKSTLDLLFWSSMLHQQVMFLSACEPYTVFQMAAMFKLRISNMDL